MSIEIIAVDEKNLREVLSLRVKKEQRTFIETPEQCLKEAETETWYEPAALYNDGIMVGFAMYGVYFGEEEGGRIWLDRYLIDERYQGQGLGNLILEALIQYLGERYEQRAIYLSVYDDNEVAVKMYKKFGFNFNGEFDINGESVMVKKL